MIDSTSEDKLYQTPKFAGAFRYNVPKGCATRVSPRGPSLALRAIHLVSRLRRRNRMCSSRVSGTAYRQGNGSTLCSPTEEKILCRSPFRSGRRSPIFARLSQRERGNSQEGGNLGVYPIVPLPGRQDSFASQAITLQASLRPPDLRRCRATHRRSRYFGPHRGRSAGK